MNNYELKIETEIIDKKLYIEYMAYKEFLQKMGRNRFKNNPDIRYKFIELKEKLKNNISRVVTLTHRKSGMTKKIRTSNLRQDIGILIMQCRNDILYELRNQREVRKINTDQLLKPLKQRDIFYSYHNKLRASVYKRSLEVVSNENHIGVELELLVDKTKYYSLLNSIKRIKNVACCDDGSLRPDENQDSIELRMLTTKENYKQDINELCYKLNELDCKVNNSCGLHVHLDMRHKTRDERNTIFFNLCKYQKLLFKLVNENRKNNEFCKKIKYADVYKNRRSRYWAINPMSLMRHDTIEIRLHHGTINPNEINNFIATLINIAYNTNEKQEKVSISKKSLINVFGPELYENYFKQHLNKGA